MAARSKSKSKFRELSDKAELKASTEKTNHSVQRLFDSFAPINFLDFSAHNLTSHRNYDTYWESSGAKPHEILVTWKKPGRYNQ